MTIITTIQANRMYIMNTDTTNVLAFINAFIDGQIKNRWEYIFSKKLHRWKSLDPYQLWKSSEKAMQLSHNFEGNINNFFIDYNLVSNSSSEVSIVRFGHDEPSITQSTFQAALIGDKSPLEGFIIFKPKDFVVCITHEDDVRVFESTQHRVNRMRAIK
jgi:hypothetical protein